MKRILIVTILLGSVVGVFSQGQITFNNRLTTGGAAGTFNEPLYQPIYGINPANPSNGGQPLQGTPNAPGGIGGAGGNPLPSTGTTDYGGRAPLAGTGFTAQLWYGTVGTPEVNLVLANSGTSTFRTSAATAGAFNGTTATLDNPAVMIPGGAGSRAVFQVRAWDNVNNTVTTWAGVLANPAVARGWSATFTPPFDLGSATSFIPNMIGMQSFGLFVPVPEPSLIALGALGLGALLLRRRKA